MTRLNHRLASLPWKASIGMVKISSQLFWREISALRNTQKGENMHMWRNVATTIAVLAFCFIHFDAAEECSASQSQELTAQVMQLDSLCQAKKPALTPGTISIKKGTTWSFRGCSDLDKQFGGRSVPLLIKITNADASPKTLSLPLLSDVTVGSEPALVLYYPWSMPGWTVDFAGKAEVQVDPGQTVELLYLVPAVKESSTVAVAGIGSVKLNMKDLLKK